MDIKSMEYMFKGYGKILEKNKVKLEFAKDNNKKMILLQDKYNKAKMVEDELNQYLLSMELFYKLCTKESNKYKESRLNYVSKFIDKKLDIVFPDESFTSKIEVEHKNGTNKAYLILNHPNGDTELPGANQGKLCQQLLSFSSATALVKCLGVNRLYLDEAFSASSPKNLAKIGNILETLVNTGMQVILIEQQTDVYKDIPRREIYIEKDPLEKATKVIYEKDF